ncbi:dolichyl-P-Man:Man(5)GlcNAc(2)-PP-dolichyl mannosyltransferase [Zychaea mexicana]|uniref:dolichyl-P-Man:Man(5)GlcNAc(2)-PP-dolichyl mannosyltransferase n=1 Tax=Zychaea mexicana TaxID=64656 RepID=UPI0022FE67E7|nr:dolichyl-P-Man:Man(5)GlcNAc(2)-PP-dolichyl mannosyltransferase [Zychaea mexicana]KAI9498152.1 dolichyl-P-Man:Man(5)GlcNAc(2)-PP-dolichyl mannosyltransferase [Zychaea mexicana]
MAPISVRRLARLPIHLLFNRDYFWYLAAMLLIGECVLNLIIINKVAYTEIDWIAYMQEVKGYLDGERDYRQLQGDTGPLVYPAGFVYIYSWLYHATNNGSNIRLAQYLFEGLYLATQLIVFAIYSKSKKIPPYTMILLCVSKRLHSIYVLRCFNDPVAMFFMYGCILAMLHRQWLLSSVLFSVALSIKMNVLLFFPAFGILLWQSVGAWVTMGYLIVVVAIQIGLAYPFLATYPDSYVNRAFEFSRVFDYEWTVNWRMVDEKAFVSPEFATALLTGHAVTLLVFLVMVWCKGTVVIKVFYYGLRNRTRMISADEIISTMFTSNFMGIVFARSLHYQFYSWYFHSLPYLLWQSVPAFLRLGTFIAIESCWLTFPSTVTSSWTLLGCHVVILLGLLTKGI